MPLLDLNFLKTYETVICTDIQIPHKPLLYNKLGNIFIRIYCARKASFGGQNLQIIAMQTSVLFFLRVKKFGLFRPGTRICYCTFWLFEVFLSQYPGRIFHRFFDGIGQARLDTIGCTSSLTGHDDHLDATQIPQLTQQIRGGDLVH